MTEFQMFVSVVAIIVIAVAFVVGVLRAQSEKTAREVAKAKAEIAKAKSAYEAFRLATRLLGGRIDTTGYYVLSPSGEWGFSDSGKVMKRYLRKMTKKEFARWADCRLEEDGTVDDGRPALFDWMDSSMDEFVEVLKVAVEARTQTLKATESVEPPDWE